MHTKFGPENPPLGIYHMDEFTQLFKDTRMFTAVLLVLTKHENNCSFVGEWLSKLLFVKAS